jgi:hypothetical protein
MTADADPLAERREADHMVREMLEEPTGSVGVLPLSKVLSPIERLEKWGDRRGRSCRLSSRNERRLSCRPRRDHGRVFRAGANSIRIRTKTWQSANNATIGI